MSHLLSSSLLFYDFTKSTFQVINPPQSSPFDSYYNYNIFNYNIYNNNNRKKKKSSIRKISHVIYLGKECYFIVNNCEIYRFRENQEHERINFNYEFLQNILKFKIKFFIGGYFHFILILENNYLFGYGENNENQLSNLDNLTEITKITDRTLQNLIYNNNNLNNNITHACCGTYSTFIVINNKTIYSCGTLNNLQNQIFTEIYTMDQEIKKISCGYGHLIILTKQNEIYGFGLNENSQLSANLKDCNNINTITKLNILNNIYSINDNNIYCKDIFALPLSHGTIFISSNNDVYLFGYLQANNFLNHEKLITGDHSLLPFINKDYYLLNCDENNKLNYKKDLFIFGGFLTTIFIDRKNGRIWNNLGNGLAEFTKNLQSFLSENYPSFFNNKNLQNEFNSCLLNGEENDDDDLYIDISCGALKSMAILIGKKRERKLEKHLKKNLLLCVEGEKSVFSDVNVFCNQ
ncbi:hypothetical protein ABK040_007412 [Willaertia magna]